MREPRPQLREGSPRTAGAHAQCLPTDFTALRWVGVTTAKMNAINNKKNANKENYRKWSNIMETTLVEMWQQRPCIFNSRTSPQSFLLLLPSVSVQRTASIMPSARYSGSIVDALLLGYVVAASTLCSSCHAQRNYCEESPHWADIKTTGTFMTKM